MLPCHFCQGYQSATAHVHPSGCQTQARLHFVLRITYAVQGLPDVTDLHSLMGAPGSLQQLLFSRNQAALALLLAASSQSNAPLPAVNLPTWDPVAMAPPTSAVAPAYIQAALLADAAARSTPCLHAEPTMLSQPSMTCYDANFGTASMADELAAAPHMLHTAGLQTWPQMMETASNPVHNYSNIFPNLHDLQQAEQPACETCLRFGPHGHGCARDTRLNRHSPY